jgi:hypothetical protein
MSIRLFSISWRICGTEYELLEDTKNQIIRDVLLFPPHSRSMPEAIGGCQIDGKEFPDAVIAVLDNAAGKAGAKALLHGTSAWKIDAVRQRFQRLDSARLICPAETIVTLDDGP